MTDGVTVGDELGTWLAVLLGVNVAEGVPEDVRLAVCVRLADCVTVAVPLRVREPL